jgi:hypothetical protein
MFSRRFFRNRSWPGARLGAVLLFSAAACAQTPNYGCGIHGIGDRLGRHAEVFAHGLKQTPREAVRPRNLAWELPTAAATVLLIKTADIPTADAIKSRSLVSASDRATNAGIGVELAAGALAFADGCHSGDAHLREASFTALAATGEAGLVDLGMKLAFDRQFPAGPGQHSTGDFWGGGRSFPSGHSATSFAFASAIAHEYPHKRWLKWGAYGLATGISVLRVPAKHHFPSDIVIGGALGYVIGAYAAEHGPGG